MSVGPRWLVPKGPIALAAVRRHIGLSSSSETAMTHRQICSERLRHSAAPGGVRYLRALASACMAALAAIVPLVPAIGTAQSAKPPPAGERQLGGPTFSDDID